MSKIETLVKMMPSSVNLIDGICGGTADITATELAAYLHGATPGEWALAEHIILGIDRQARVCGILYDIGREWKEPKHPKRIGTEMRMPILNRLAELAFIEYTRCSYCPLCRGQKKVAAQTCPMCDGSGHVHLPDSDRAEFCYVRADRWELWEPLHHRFTEVINDWHGNNCRKIVHELLDD